MTVQAFLMACHHTEITDARILLKLLAERPGRIFDEDRRHAAVDDALVAMHLRWREVQLVCVMVTRRENAAQDVAHLGFVVDELEQRLSARALLADAENVLCCRVEPDNQEVLVEQDDARAQVVEYVPGGSLRGTAVAGTGIVIASSRGAGLVVRVYRREFCCT